MKRKEESVHEKIMDLATLLRVCAGWRVKSRKIVFTNGCFDILHPGHVVLLLKAAEAGNKLVVGLNADVSVKKLKGAGRPVNREADRALLLAAQTYVDAVVLFEEETPVNLIKAIVPDVIVKGGDYTADTVAGGDFIRERGGEVLIVPLLGDFSTTSLIKKIK
jgi:D-beta-D-heptose 7-phosphate kinase/D-beta-D-heptose 1-phosphate adenosyltransferase